MEISSGYLQSEAGKLIRQRSLMLLTLVVGLILFLLVDLSTGPADMTLSQIVKGILNPDSLELRHRIILWDVRLPDALIALAAGAALGLSGVETQTILNNPMASPFTLGISSFASFGASIAIVFLPTFGLVSQALVVPMFALAFAILSAFMVLSFSRLVGGGRENVVLFGLALFFLGDALTAALQYVGTAEAVQQIVFWTIGNLTKAGWVEVAAVSLCFVIILPFSLRHVWVMTLLRAGEEQAASMGLNMGRLRLWVLLRVSVLCAFAVCFVGAIGFVGLVAPHIARLLVGEDHRFLVPAAALCGALLLSFASILSKALLPGVIIPVGIITAVVGVPVFLYLIVKRGRHL